MSDKKKKTMGDSRELRSGRRGSPEQIADSIVDILWIDRANQWKRRKGSCAGGSDETRSSNTTAQLPAAGHWIADNRRRHEHDPS
jgi:hypothetical protein